MQVRRWLPGQPTHIGRHDWPDEGDDGTYLRLRAGSIVVLDRQAWRVLEINDYTGAWWPESYEKAWGDHVELWWHANELRRANNQADKPAPERAEFYKRPVVLVLRSENLPRSTPKHWCAPASHDWQVLPEHYAVCRACGELPPCHHGEYRWEGGPRQPEQNGGIPLMVPEGCCMGCAEPIKPRGRTVQFPGPNLWYPDLGENTAVFHTRTACADQVDCYRMQWQAQYSPRASTHSATLAFPGFEHFLLPRTRRAPDLTPHVQQISQGSYSAQSSPVPPSRPEEEAHASPVNGSGTFHPPFDRYRREPETGAMPVGPSASAVPEPAHHPAPAVSRAPAANPALPVRSVAPGSPPPAEAYAPASPPPPAESAGAAGAAVQAAQELGLSLAGHPAFHNAEQAARVIEELTAAVRNIALCLNNPAARERP
ncbi:hypothetical protein [Streptomyces rhizosphaerihabitans]|uniref:hypothetical protein n=1 Tax=Streptomyces rhizosphaerihabitans TaxID=1266770 RepID=UPI0021C21F6E|nr:hypothetical protein [Streptomyces rhizosphaerihabitans]MCT9005416.1 hypothetical protein [Streptomyces rhizosphaerihabitans]